MNAHEIENAIEHAINALSLAKLALSKSALPMFNESDVLRKVNEPRASAKKPLTTADYAAALADLEDLTKRAAKLGAKRDMDNQHSLRKTVSYNEDKR
jgi:hypothetical protein